MDFGRGLLGTAVADDRLANDQRRLVGRPPSLLDGSVDRLHVMSVDRPNYVPVIRFKAPGDILSKNEIGGAFNLNVVVVIQVDQFAQAERPSQAGRFAGHAFLHVAVGDYGIYEMVDEPVVWTVIVLGHPALRDGHAHPVGESLAERSGGDLHTRRLGILRVARCFAAPLSEVHQVLQGQIITG